MVCNLFYAESEKLDGEEPDTEPERCEADDLHDLLVAIRTNVNVGWAK
jgi:hypothetical protein